jgi:hypothetical protein
MTSTITIHGDMYVLIGTLVPTYNTSTDTGSCEDGYSTERVVVPVPTYESNVHMLRGTSYTPFRICPRASASEHAHPSPCDCGPNVDHEIHQTIHIVGCINPPSLSRPRRYWYCPTLNNNTINILSEKVHATRLRVECVRWCLGGVWERFWGVLKPLAGVAKPSQTRKLYEKGPMGFLKPRAGLRGV